MNAYYACACGRLYLDRKRFVRHRMSARKSTRSIIHEFLGKFWIVEGEK